MKQLTRAEEQIMQVLWKLENAFVKQIIAELPLPKPAYNTVSTIIRILETKQFVGHTSFGKKYQYFPLISKSDYRKSQFGGFISNYFENSYKSLASFFTKEENLTLEELEDINRLIQEEINKKKNS
ncbi:MAG: BlaI/MecI/CopY family transcriptional regulator [Bacteroidetes bacterium]|nr:MAG: BlaI/MecI/CopY family transcriptional regulator [Bacteroidota bacterium]